MQRRKRSRFRHRTEQLPEPAELGHCAYRPADEEVTLEGPAQTLVSCYYITTYATIALGVDDRVVGLENKPESRPIYQMAAPGCWRQARWAA